MGGRLQNDLIHGPPLTSAERLPAAVPEKITKPGDCAQIINSGAVRRPALTQPRGTCHVRYGVRGLARRKALVLAVGGMPGIAGAAGQASLAV